jgi:ATP-binding cassette, subfamily B, bacterial
VATESQLWDRLLAVPYATYLAMSNRRYVLERADRVVVMRDERVEAQGSPQELLAATSTFREIWQRADTSDEELPPWGGVTGH